VFTRPWNDLEKRRRIAVLCREAAPIFDQKRKQLTAEAFLRYSRELAGDLDEQQARQIFVDIFELITIGWGGPTDEPVPAADGSIDWVASNRLDELQEQMVKETKATFRRSPRFRRVRVRS
jgi:hypothetical protein